MDFACEIQLFKYFYTCYMFFKTLQKEPKKLMRKLLSKPMNPLPQTILSGRSSPKTLEKVGKYVLIQKIFFPQFCLAGG